MTTNRNKRLLWQLPFLTILIIGTVLIIRQQHATPYQKCAGTIFGTTYHVTYQYDDDLQQELEAKMKEVDASLSMFNKESTISRVNNNQRTELTRMFVEVFQQAQKISEDTNGAFDITVGPLVNAWGFGFKNEQLPDKHAVDSLMAIIGYKKVSYDGKQIAKSDPRITLDCSAIAKGYGVDAVSNYLSSEGITDFMVEIGGEVRVKGKNKEGHNWRIGINEPIDDSLSVNNELQNVLEVTEDGMSMATSGNYRNFYIKNNKKYAHTIDPKTGYPVQHNILSSTVLAEDCMTADAYATAFMVAGLEKSKAILQKVKGIKAYFIYAKDDGTNGVWHSPGLKLDDD